MAKNGKNHPASDHPLADLSLKQLVKRAHKFAEPYRVSKATGFHLKHVDPADTGGLGSEDKPRAKEALQFGVQALTQLQECLWAEDRAALLLVFQSMDAAGKDGAIKHVMSGVNPQGCEVTSFKAPTSTDLDHDYLWRTHLKMPERGRIGIFNRSYYEDVLVVRVHPELLETQKLPAEVVDQKIWDKRYQDIRTFERYLDRQGVVIRKFFLYLSRDEQKRRFMDRLEDPEKNWKFSANDIREREHWDAYMDAYEDAIRKTATEAAPWYVVPADNKWFTRVVVAAAIVDALASLDLRYPKVTSAQRKVLAAARRQLSAEA